MIRNGRSFSRLLALAALIAWPGQASMQVGGELHTFHCLHGCPVSAPTIDDIVVREIYTLASNDLTKVVD